MSKTKSNVFRYCSTHTLRNTAVDAKQFRRDMKMYLFAGHSKRQRIRGVT